MDNIGKDSNGCMVMLDCKEHIVSVFHVDAPIMSTFHDRDAYIKSCNTQEIDKADYDIYLHCGDKRQFYNFICDKYKVTL